MHCNLIGIISLDEKVALDNYVSMHQPKYVFTYLFADQILFSIISWIITVAL